MIIRLNNKSFKVKIVSPEYILLENSYTNKLYLVLYSSCDISRVYAELNTRGIREVILDLNHHFNVVNETILDQQYV